MSKRKKPATTTPESVNETRLELLEKELRGLTEKNTTLEEENATLRDKVKVLNEKFVAATKGVKVSGKSSNTVFPVGSDRYEFKYPVFNYNGRKITAADIAKDPELLEQFIAAGNAKKL